MRIPHRPHSLFALLMMVSLPLSARTTSEWELSVGGGWSTFTYAVRSPFESLRVSQAGSWAATAHGAYTCMFTDYIGLGVALDMTRYGASITADGWVQWDNQMDTDGERYHHRMTVSDAADRQEVWYFHPGLDIKGRVPIGKQLAWAIIVGGRYGLPVSARTERTGTYTHTGIYPQWGLSLYDMPPHGFYTASGQAEAPAITPLPVWALAARTGMEWKITEQIVFVARVWATYAFNKAFDLPAYETVEVTNPSAQPLAAGLEIGIYYAMPHIKHKQVPCRCLDIQ